MPKAATIVVGAAGLTAALLAVAFLADLSTVRRTALVSKAYRARKQQLFAGANDVDFGTESGVKEAMDGAKDDQMNIMMMKGRVADNKNAQMEKLKKLMGQIQVFQKKEDDFYKAIEAPAHVDIQVTQGTPGKIGPRGHRGQEGAQGDEGAKGATGKVGPVGPVGVEGDMGPQGIKGEKGDKGDKGPKGVTGPQVRFRFLAPGGRIHENASSKRLHMCLSRVPWESAVIEAQLVLKAPRVNQVRRELLASAESTGSRVLLGLWGRCEQL